MDVLENEPFSTIQVLWKDITFEDAEILFEDIVLRYPVQDESILRYPYPSYIYCTSPLWSFKILEETKHIPEEIASFSRFDDVESRRRSCKHLTVFCQEINIDDLDIIVSFHGGFILRKREKILILEFDSFDAAAKAFFDFTLLRIHVWFTNKQDLEIKDCKFFN